MRFAPKTWRQSITWVHSTFCRIRISQVVDSLKISRASRVNLDQKYDYRHYQIAAITSGVAQKVGEPAFKTNNWAMLTFEPDRLLVNWHGSRAKEFDRASLQAESTAQHRALSIDTTTWKRASP